MANYCEFIHILFKYELANIFPIRVYLRYYLVKIVAFLFSYIYTRGARLKREKTSTKVGSVFDRHFSQIN